MKKGLFALIVLVLSYAILAVGNNLGGGAAAGADAATLTATAKGDGGDVTVTVKTSGDKIVDVKA
ncbi:MAG TPA: FMN-binding protein, partial [Clostridiales bacterium]|nr:FMN-binding protein [Clostridiales bacterium]